MSISYTLSLSRKSAVQVTPEVLALANGFGIGTDEEHEMLFYKDLAVSLGPGRIVYINGESGAGKTSLLRQLRDAAVKDFKVVDTGTKMQCPFMPEGTPLISMFGTTTKIAAGTLSMAGLSEPFVMLRKPEELSDGQRYRLGIAWTIHQAARTPLSVVFLDEFLAVLDRSQAKAVAANLRRAVDAHKFCAVVATTHDDLVEDLNPNCTIRLRLNQSPQVQAHLRSVLESAPEGEKAKSAKPTKAPRKK